MPVPDFQTLMLPLLRNAADAKEHAFKDAVESIAAELKLTEEDRQQLLPSGRSPLFYNRLAWAKTHLTMAGLLEAPRRGVFRITPRGVNLLAQRLVRIDINTLQQFPEYDRARRGDAVVSDAANLQASEAPNALTPEETIEQAHQILRRELVGEVLASIMKCTPAFFELLIVKLMIKMGYGGSRAEAGKAVGRSGDGGIDGIINEDRLGLDAIYLQAKRWEGVVGRPEIMKFVGALAGQRASKGVFITTSWFTQEAKDYATSSQYKVVLIDGERLADLMIEHDLGVSIAATYLLKRIDSDFFSEE